MKLKEIAEKLNCLFHGDPELEITCVCGLKNLKQNALAYMEDPKILKSVPTPDSKKNLTINGVNLSEIAILVHSGFTPLEHSNLIFSEDPLWHHIEAIKFLYPSSSSLNSKSKINKSADVGKNVKIGKKTTIDAKAVICDNVTIGENTTIKAGAVIMEGVKIGDNTLIYPNVVIREKCEIGNNVIIQPNAVIGADGHGYFQRKGKNYKIPQIGIVVIEDDVEIGACTCIDRARFDKTIIKKGCKIDNQVQIAHNVVLGENALISGQAAIAGSAQIGKNLILGGQSGIRDNITVGDNVIIAGKSGLSSTTQDNQILGGTPAIPINKWRKKTAILNNIETYIKKLKALEKKLSE